MHQNYTWATLVLTQPAVITRALGPGTKQSPITLGDAFSLLLLALLLSLQLPHVSPSSVEVHLKLGGPVSVLSLQDYPSLLLLSVS